MTNFTESEVAALVAAKSALDRMLEGLSSEQKKNLILLLLEATK